MNMRTRSLLIILGILSLVQPFSAEAKSKHWVGTWGTAPQLVEPNNMPPKPGLSNRALRQVFRVSIGGEAIRLKLSNEYSDSSITIKAATIALSTGGSQIDEKSMRPLTFNKSKNISIKANGTILSDPIDFKISPRCEVAVTLYFEETPKRLTGHPGSRTTSYIAENNHPEQAEFSNAVKTDHWYVINRLDVLASKKSASVAILGNSITDGRGSTTNAQNRWPDILSERLLNNPSTNNVGVLNMGIGGNCMLNGGLGPTGLKRFQSDVLDQPGIKWAIIYLGVNDLGGVRNEASAKRTANNLIEAYKKCIDLLKKKKIGVYGATIMPFKGNGYYNVSSESARKTVNDWIRSSQMFDAVIDFDLVLQDPSDSISLHSDFDFQNDFLHPSPQGHALMGQFVDLKLFQPKKKRFFIF